MTRTRQPQRSGAQLLFALTALFPALALPSRAVPAPRFNPWCSSGVDNVTDAATGAAYCREWAGCGRYGSSSTTLSCPGPCPAWEEGDPPVCVRESDYPPEEVTPLFRAALTFVQEDDSFCLYSTDVRDDRGVTRFHYEANGAFDVCCPSKPDPSSDAPCGGCPWTLLSADPRFVWNSKGRSGSIVSNTMSNMLEYQAFCTSNATGDPCPRRDDRVAPRSSTAYNGTFNQNVGGVIDSWNAPQRFTIVGRSPRGLPACMSKDGRACLWLDRELCVSRLYETADWTTPLLECGAANKALYNETGFEEPTHWCSRAVWLWPWAYPDAPEPRPPPPRPTRTSTGVPQSTRRPSSAGRQTAGFCGTIATAMIVAFLM